MTRFEPLSLSSHKAILKENKPRWFTSAIALDWLLVIGLQFLNIYLDSKPPYYQDPALWLNDPTLTYPHLELQRVPDYLLYTLTLWLPLGIIILVGAARYSAFEIHHGVLSYLAGYNMTWFLTDYIKLQFGRLRPDFLDRCKYDMVQKVCTGAEDIVREGRKSFPSGHSSSSFYAGIFLLLFLAGKNRAFLFNPSPISSSAFLGIFQSKLFKFYLAFLPIVMSLWIVISRWQDHVHHPIDILAGSILGITIAFLAYLMWFPSPFSETNRSTMSLPRKLQEKDLIDREQTEDDLERQALLGRRA